MQLSASCAVGLWTGDFGPGLGTGISFVDESLDWAMNYDAHRDFPVRLSPGYALDKPHFGVIPVLLGHSC